jgi:glycosyltransferase involved in cell wall biosynthesis
MPDDVSNLCLLNGGHKKRITINQQPSSESLKAKIKVLHIIKSLGRGGAEMLLPETLKLHDHEQFEFHYIYFLPWKDQLVESLRQAGGVVHCFSASNNLLILWQFRKVLRYVRKHQIDMIHCHLPWAGFLGRIVHRLSKIPMLYSEHNKQERYHGITFFLNKITFNWQTLVIAVSEDAKASIQSNIAPSIPVLTVLNGVNVQAFQRDTEAGLSLRQQLGIPQEALVVGTIAVFRFQKRLIEWMEVAARVLSQNPDSYFVMVGDGPLKDEIMKKRQELKLENRVIMGGLQSDVKPWLSMMDVYMMSSIFEGLPIAMLEAMSMECAIVTTDAGGIKEVIRHEQDGLMVGVDSWTTLVKEVELLKDALKRKQLGIAARKRVQESFSLQVMVNELEILYKLNVKSSTVAK